MQTMICEMCGSDDLVKQDGLYVCQRCGTKYSVDEARKLFGAVKIDESEEAQNYLTLARRARADGDDVNAEKYYDLVLQQDPNNWEAAYYSVHANVRQCMIKDIRPAALRLFKGAKSAYVLIGEHVQDQDACAKAYFQVTDDATGLLVSLYNSLEGHFLGIDSGSRANYRTGFLDSADAIARLTSSLADELDVHFHDDEAVTTSKVMAWKCALNIYYRCDNAYYSTPIAQLAEKIKACEPDYELPDYISGRGAAATGGCYVATAVYGSYDCPQVWTLRRYRDNVLAMSFLGRLFIRTYYACSPTIVKWFGNTSWFKNLWKKPLDRIVAKLQLKGTEATPYEDRKW